MLKLCDGVFEGGGVKGIGLVGAVTVVEAQGYEFANVAGTSAGAIVASLIAVGYKGYEIKQILEETNFKSFQQGDLIGKAGLIGKVAKILMKNGIYKTSYFESWLTNLLEKKGKKYFGDIKISDCANSEYLYKFQAIASDLSDNKMLILPQDLKQLGIDPDAFPIATAVRMSMSIPIYFEPYVLKDAYGRDHLIVDGGLLSNYPIWLLDANTKWPTFGFKFYSQDKLKDATDDYKKIDNTVEFAQALIKTSIDAHDNYYISTSKGDYQRTIQISTIVTEDGKHTPINAVDFDITKKQGDALYQNGVTSAKSFFETWNFDSWVKKYRS